MKRTILTISVWLVFSMLGFAQFYKLNFVGISMGSGGEIKNRNYSYTNRTIKLEGYFLLADSNKWRFEVLLQPEINFAKHQLLNLYFVTPNEPDYEALRARYTKLKDVTEYVFGIGFIARRTLSEHFDVFGYVSVGPMITNTQTERLSKGLAFADVFAFGISYKYKSLRFDVRPNFRHISNAGLQSSNAGFNTVNIDFGVGVKL